MSLLQVDTIRNRSGDGAPLFDRGISVTGVITSTSIKVSSVGIGSTEVISSSFQLKNITSIDSTTLSTLEIALEAAPNNFNSLYIGGGGISTFTGNVYAAGITTVNNDLYVNGTLFSSSSGASLSSLSIGSTQVISSSRELQNITSLDSVTTATIESAIVNTPNIFNDLVITGISTFTNGPILVGSGTSTGTASQKLQVTGGAYVSGNVGLGTTNPTSKLTVIGDALITGTLSALNFSGITTYSDNAGIATNVIGGIGSISQLRVSGISTFIGVTEFKNIVFAEQDLFVTNYFTANQVAIGTLTNIADVASKNFGKTLNIGNDLIMFHLNQPSEFRRSNWIISDEYDLFLGTKSEGSTNIITGLIGIQTGNDINPGNTADVYVGYGTAGPKLTTTGYGVSVTGSLSATDSIGIGTTNPTSRLQVQGDALINGNLNVSIGGTFPIISTLIGESSGYNGSGIAVTQTRYGIGIGTTNPFIPFYSDSDSQITNTFTFYNTEWISANSYNNSITRIGSDSGRSIEIGMGNTDLPKYIDFGGGNFPELLYPDWQTRILRNGTDDGSLQILNRGNGTVSISAGQTAGELGNFDIFTANTRRLRVSSTGNIGLNVLNPTSRLHVSGDALITGVVTATTFNGNINASVGTITNLNVSGVTTTTILNVGTGGTIITTTSNGSVGIGTTNPRSKLEINGVLGFTNSNIAIGDTFTGGQLTLTSFENILIGPYAGYPLTTGDYNTIIGPYAAGYSINPSASKNVIIGVEAAGEFNGTQRNVIIGEQSGYSAGSNTSEAIIIGYRAGYNQSGFANIILGDNAGYLSNGNNNLFMGYNAGYSNAGSDNVMLGNSAGASHTTGSGNLYLGSYAASAASIGNYNISLGYESGGTFDFTDGDGNIFIGYRAGGNQKSGSNNVAIGYNLNVPNLNGNNQLAIGVGATNWITGNSNFNVGIGTTNATSKLTVQGNTLVTGIVTATGGFISVGNTTPIQISLIGNQLTFTAVGIGSTTLTLS